MSSFAGPLSRSNETVLYEMEESRWSVILHTWMGQDALTTSNELCDFTAILVNLHVEDLGCDLLLIIL